MFFMDLLWAFLHILCPLLILCASNLLHKPQERSARCWNGLKARTLGAPGKTAPEGCRAQAAGGRRVRAGAGQSPQSRTSHGICAAPSLAPNPGTLSPSPFFLCEAHFCSAELREDFQLYCGCVLTLWPPVAPGDPWPSGPQACEPQSHLRSASLSPT